MTKSSRPVPYLASVINDYRKNLAQTGAAMGHAVLFLAICHDQLTDEQRQAHDVIQKAEADLNRIQKDLTYALAVLTITDTDDRTSTHG